MHGAWKMEMIILNFVYLMMKCYLKSSCNYCVKICLVLALLPLQRLKQEVPREAAAVLGL